MVERSYVASLRRTHLTREQVDLVERRTRPFLDAFGMDKPISFLLQEAYLQGLRDASATLASKGVDRG